MLKVVLFNLALSSVLNWLLDAVGLQWIVGSPAPPGCYRTSGASTEAFCQVLSEPH